MPGFETYRRWLVAVGSALVVFGLAMALTSSTPVFDIVNGLIDPAFWGDARPSAEEARFQAWAYGVWGSTIAGWGVVIVFVAREAFRRRERWAWQALALGTGLWFVLDTGLSIAYGVGFNVAFNIGVVVAVAVPLAATRDSFR